MPMRGSKRGLLLATLTLVTLAARPALAAFDIDIVIDPETTKHVQFQKVSQARDFIDHVAVYLRVMPAKGDRVFPVFINTKNYLTCDDSEKRWNLNDVKQVAFERRSGMKVFGFFFGKPTCEKATYHIEAVVGAS
jgi:hypothetical protein